MKCTFSLVLLFFCANVFFAQNSPTLNEKKKDSLLEYHYSNAVKSFYLSKDKGQSNKAFELALASLKYGKTIKNDSLIGRAYNSLGFILLILKDFDKALLNTKKARDIFLKINNKRHTSMSNNNIGVIYREVGLIDSSTVYFKKNLKINEKENDVKNAAISYFNIGYNNYLSNNNSKALFYLNKALDLSKNMNYRIIGEIYSTMGEIYKAQNNYKLALFYYDKGIDYAKSNGNLIYMTYIYEEKVDLFEDKGDEPMLNSSLEKLIKIKDSVRVIAKNDLRKEIETKYLLEENKAKIEFVEKEKVVQKELLEKSKVFNMFLGILMSILVVTAYWVYIKNKELKKAKERAEKLSEVKSDFYSEISHELRTPLYAVIELSNLLLKENVNAKHREYLESLKFSGNHLLSLISNVLQLNKVESGKVQLQELNFNLKELITNIIDSLEFALRDSGNKIILDYDYNIPNGLVGDSLKLSQIFINLISNAIKFTNNGNIEIIIKERKEANKANEIKILFSVKDDGIGISKEKQDKVFEDFYQELAENENSYKGTGLGLAIVKKTLAAMHSNIQIESEEGEGAIFFFEIAFKKQSDENCGDVICMDELGIIRGYNILIVDDNKINQIVTKKVLDQLDVQSSVVGSGKDAIEIVKKEHFDCILMDLHMPDMDGYETSKFIREFNRDISIVALTAASSEEVEKKINNYEMDGYILKPFILNNFIATITSAVNKKDKSIA